MSDSGNKIEVTNGNKRAVFNRTDKGWTPGWFYEGDREMLRFKDHQWLTFSHVQEDTAQEAKTHPDGGAEFKGMTLYGKTEVPWAVSVRPDPLGDGFVVECSFTPAKSIELVEAYATFETPYDYDGEEVATTVIGMNPVFKWRGGRQLSPPIWKLPGWLYTRPQAARITGPCNAPYLCQSLEPVGGDPPRHIMVVGDWTVCRGRDVFVTPTRDTKNAPPGAFGNAADKKGYKYIVAAMNWSSAWAKDPNVFFKGGEAHRQRLAIDFSTALPGATNDEFYLKAWQRACAFSFPNDGKVEANERTSARGVTWQSATEWMHDKFRGKYSQFFFDPERGHGGYALGSRPKAWDSYHWGAWQQWGGPLHYRAALLGDEELAACCKKYDARYAEHKKKNPGGGVGPGLMPGIWWARREGGKGPFAEALKRVVENSYEVSIAENGKKRKMDWGYQCTVAEALFLGYITWGETAFRDQAELLIKEINPRLDENFWSFNCGAADALVHGGQVRSHGHSHGILANVLAHEVLGGDEYLATAHRFGRFLLSMCYACHNGSKDPEFDFRGWCNGSNGGRDQIAEFPPWETAVGLLGLAGLMSTLDVEPGFHDVLWYFARTGLAQYPAARTLKRILGEDYSIHYIPREEIASEQDFYDASEYLSYENPYDQTLQANYQGTDGLLVDLVMGGGLARADDDRLGVFVPDAALLDMNQLTRREVHVWNPLRETIRSKVTVTWPDRSTAEQGVTVPPREKVKVGFGR